MMMTIIQVTIIPSKMPGVVLLPCVGISGDVAGVVVGQVAGDRITTTVVTPVNKNKARLCCYYD